MCRLSRNSVSLNLLEVSGPVQVSVGIDLSLTYYLLLLANLLNASGSMIDIAYVTKQHYAADLLVKSEFVDCEVETEIYVRVTIS